jgi:hypothetical protein
MADFGWKPQKYDEWIDGNRFRCEAFSKERRGPQLLIPRRQVKKPVMQKHR